jgi:hypothetical protein
MPVDLKMMPARPGNGRATYGRRDGALTESAGLLPGASGAFATRDGQPKTLWGLMIDVSERGGVRDASAYHC